MAAQEGARDWPTTISLGVLVEEASTYERGTPQVIPRAGLTASVRLRLDGHLNDLRVQGPPAALRKFAAELVAAAEVAEQALAAWQLAAPLAAPTGRPEGGQQ
jgi:hypothetical protein